MSLRYFDAAGAAMDGSIGEDSAASFGLVPNVLRAALPDATAIRDYIHVADLADAPVRALAYLEDGGPILTLNVGTGTGSPILEVIEAARQVTQTDIRVLSGERRPGDPAAVSADSTLARRRLAGSLVMGSPRS